MCVSLSLFRWAQIGGLLDSKGFGIATPKGSPWRDRISLAILELQEKAVIHLLYNKWWKDTGEVCNREQQNKESKASALGVQNIGRAGKKETTFFIRFNLWKIYLNFFSTRILSPSKFEIFPRLIFALEKSKLHRDFYFLRIFSGGVFVVLLCGLAMAIVVAILEFCWNSKRNAQQEKVTDKN